MKIKDTERRFLLHWGEMGSRWGINRAAAQVHALLLLSDSALDAEEIGETLQLARSNISVSLRELQSWGLIKAFHRIGSRREFFEADKDPWSFLAKIAEKRIERELLPTLQEMKQLSEQRGLSPQLTRLTYDMTEILEGGIHFFRKIRSFPTSLARKLFKFDKKIENLLKPKGNAHE